MGSDKRGGAQGKAGAGRGPRPVVTGPGSVNRGFASVDPERQREPDAQGGSAADDDARIPQEGRRVPASRAATPPGVARRGRGAPGADDEGGSA